MPLMSMNEKLPTPSEKYKTLQQLLTQAIDARPRRSDETEINLRSLLKKEFEKAFNLKISRGSHGSRKQEAKRLLQDVSGNFDHVDFATHPGFDGEILISQPYDLDTEVHQHAAAKFGYTFTQADGWTYYYPAKSHLFIVTVSRDVIQQLRKGASGV
jgi:hypothetical protein